MRLIPARAGGGESGANLRGMMAVIVDHGHAALRAAHLKSPVDATESCQRLANRLDRNLEFQADSDRGGGVQHVVRAGDVQVEAAQVASPRNSQMKFAGHVAGGAVT